MMAWIALIVVIVGTLINEIIKVAAPHLALRGDDLVQLPDERGGELMVFRVFEKVSFGLIMESTRALHVNDRVRNP